MLRTCSPQAIDSFYTCGVEIKAMHSISSASSVSVGSFSAAHCKFLSVRFVPEAEVNPGVLNGSY
jgi:hypothetical protein